MDKPSIKGINMFRNPTCHGASARTGSVTHSNGYSSTCLSQALLVSAQINQVINSPCHAVIGFIMRLVGPCFCVGFYYLMLKHTYVFLVIICPVLRKRLGVPFGIIWTIIGVVITYNVVWNHMLAMCLKPGSPKDLIVSHRH